MANIPLVQIPNAPATGSTAVPLPVGAIRTPDVELMGMIDDASYMAVGRAYENLGNAGQQAANVLGDFSLSMARASDEANLAAADRIKTDMVSKFDAEVATKPESEWNSIWENNYAPKLRDQVSSLKMTTRDGLNRRDVWLANTENGIKAQVFTNANKAMIGRATQEQTNLVERAKAEGRYEDAMGALRRGAEVGLWTPEAADAGMIKIEQEQKAETKRQLWETVDTQMIQRLADGSTAEADEVTADLRQAVESGSFESKFFPSLNGEPADIKKALKMWEGHSQNATIDNYNEAVTGIAEGQYGTVDELRDEWSDKLDTINMQKLEAAFNQSPEEQSKRLAQRPQLVTAIDLYDPSVDQESKEFDRLLSWVHTMPAGFQADLSQMLRDKKKDAQPKPSTAIEAIKQRSREMFTLGKYGSIKNEEAWQAAKTRQSREIDMLNSWASANPKEAADATKVTEQYNQIRTKIYQEDMADGVADTPKPEMLQAPTINPRRVLQDPRFGPQTNAGTRRAPASIRNNNAGAMWYVGGWQKKFGAEYGQKLNDGLGQGNQIAKFPTPVHGAAALLYQLDRPSYRNSSVRQAIAKWSGGNSVSSYLSILQSAGFTADQSVAEIMASPEDAIAFAQAMARHEAGQDFPLDNSGWQQAYEMYRSA
jgi:hypothetical protein